MQEWQRSVEIKKLDEDRNLVFGFLSVAKNADGTDIVDLQGDVIPVPELETAAYDFVLHFRDADQMHDEQSIGKLVESVVLSKEKQDALGIPAGAVPEGWWVGFKVEPSVFAKVKGGDLRGFSIGGEAVRS